MPQLTRLIKKVNSGISDLDLFAIRLRRKPAITTVDEDWMQNEDVMHELGDDEAKVVEAEVDKAKAKRHASDEVLIFLKTQHKSVLPPAPEPPPADAPGPKRGRGRGRGVSRGVPRGKAAAAGAGAPRLAVATLAADNIDPAVAQSMAPPNCRIHRDTFNGRWRASWRAPYTALYGPSRSWGMRQERPALVAVLQSTWREWCSLTEQPCDVDGIDIPEK